MNIEESINNFIMYIANERRLSSYTIRNYSKDLELFRLFAKSNGVERVEDLDARLIRDWQMQRMKTHSHRDTNRAISSLRSWCKYLRCQQILKKDPFQKISTVKTEKKLPIFFKESEVEHIYDADIFPNTFDGERDKLLLRLLYETGIRCAEVIGITEHSIDFGNKQLKVLGKRNKERIIPLENELLQNISRFVALKKENGIEGDALLTNERGRKLSHTKVYNVVHYYMGMLSNADRISPHVFRHTFATQMLNEGANIDAVKELLGHTDLMATEVYTHVTREHLKDAYKHAHPRANNKKTN